MWQKISSDQHSDYKDICNGSKTADRPEIIYRSLKSMGCMTPKPKSDSGAEMCRQIGNQQFAKRKWSEAMGLYNRSLCAAQPNSAKMIILAYANRSAVWFELKKYEKCLLDIDFAQEVGYPVHLKEKLKARQTSCFELIENGAQSPEFEPELSFEECKNYLGNKAQQRIWASRNSQV